MQLGDLALLEGRVREGRSGGGLIYRDKVARLNVG
jgi:hypothetical protein